MPQTTEHPFATAVMELTKEVITLRDALARAADELDYCFVCDNHPSHGHGDNCLLADLFKSGSELWKKGSKCATPSSRA